MEERTTMGAFTLAEGITTEEMKAVFFDTQALRVPEYRLHQLNTRGARYYYTINAEGVPSFYPSVTTILGEVSPRNPFLEKWRAEMGLEEADAYTNERANYGTFLHSQIEKFLIARSYDLDGLKGELAKYIERNQLPTDFINYAEDLKRDMLAFAQFAKDYDVKPLCTEESLYSPSGRYAGCIDLVAVIYKYAHEDGKKAKSDERIVAMIDFKSGRKGFHESHINQLYLYRDMWKENFPEIEIQGVYNWSPKDWRTSPTYNFKCQDDALDVRIAYSLLEQYHLRAKALKDVTLVGGTISLDNPITNCYQTISLEELVLTREEKRAAEEEDDSDNLFPETTE